MSAQPLALRTCHDFRATLSMRDPIDVEAFLQHSGDAKDLLQLCLLADTWEPEACAILANNFTQMSLNYSAGELLNTLHQTAKEMSPSLGYYALHDPRRSHLKVLSLGGACRCFGCLSLFKRLGIVADMGTSDAPELAPGTITLGLGRQRLKLVKDTSVLQQLTSTVAFARKAYARAKASLSRGDGQKLVEDLQGYVFSTGIPLCMQWGRQPNYHGDHLVRKIMLHMLQATGAPWPFDRQAWAQAAPDVSCYMERVPSCLTAKRLAGAFQPMDISRLEMWACLMGMALQGVGALTVDGFAEAVQAGQVTPLIWAQADAMAFQVGQHAAPPLWVAHFCMKVLRGDAIVTEADRHFLLTTAPERNGRFTVG